MYPTNPKLGCPYNTGTSQLSSGSLDKMACSIFGDIVQVAPARMIAQTMARDGVTVYSYRFNHLQRNTSAVSKGIGTGVEQAYVFSNFDSSHPWDQNMAYQMSTAWISFANDLDPNTGTVGKTAPVPVIPGCFVITTDFSSGAGLPKWPQYGRKANSIVFNGYGSHIEHDTYRSESIQYIIDRVLLDGAS